jgi:hypothetical protein
MPPSSSELISAVRHPLRRRILRIYLDDSLELASTTELARAVGERLGPVAYHLKTLARCEVLRPVRADDGGGVYVWALGVEPDWLRLVLDAYAES